MIINGVELPNLDAADADVMEHYESVIEKTTNEFLAVDTKNSKRSEVIRKECQIIFTALNALFGEGTDRKVFGGKTNLLVCLDAYSELIEAVNQIDAQNAKKIRASADKRFNPNRSSKKNKKNKKKKYNHMRPKLVAPEKQ